MVARRAEMREAVFFDGPDIGRKISRFWMLLVLAAIIASAGVIADSEATVIGAMIVAPLRTPILGTMLAVVLADRANLARSVAMLAGGAAAAVGVGFVMAALAIDETAVRSSEQIAEWATPSLVDLVAALAVGAVGSIALVRHDISDTLPGVAIAISLVPPLTVVGISIAIGHGDLALGAFLLFATNVAAILSVGVVVMALYRVRRSGADTPIAEPDEQVVNQREAYWVIGVSLLVIGLVLARGTWRTAQNERHEANIGRIAALWAEPQGFDVVDVSTDEDVVVVRIEGPLPPPDIDDLRADLEAADIDADDIEIALTPRYSLHPGDDG